MFFSVLTSLVHCDVGNLPHQKEMSFEFLKEDSDTRDVIQHTSLEETKTQFISFVEVEQKKMKFNILTSIVNG